MAKTKVTSFVNQFLAVVKGDSAKAQAEKVFRQAQSALNVQISSGTGDTINFEDALESAKEKLKLARVNDGRIITDRNAYVLNLLNAKNDLIDAEEKLERHKAKIAFLQETLNQLESEEDIISAE